MSPIPTPRRSATAVGRETWPDAVGIEPSTTSSASKRGSDGAGTPS
ncbi:Uncharacterised protein [Mycobacteroides abscessus]|nr:Uncharacterised protein [Mycobacteroides abscessus]